MAAEDCRKRLKDEVTCAVCLDFFADPVLLDCGHNFCRACTVKCWGKSPSRAVKPCPQCKERVKTGNIKPNKQLASVTELVRELSGLPRQDSAICERHQEPLKLYCQDDQSSICLVCDTSLEHTEHHVVTMEEAAKEYKDQISRSLENLRKERENVSVYTAKDEKESQDLLEQIEAEREKTAAAFRRLHRFLEEEEKPLLARMEDVKKAIAKRSATLSAEVSSLDSLIQELEEKQQQSMNDLLQNIGNVLERCKIESSEKPMAFPAALKWKVHDFCDINPFLEALIKQFQDSLVSGLQLQEACVTLDPDMAHPELFLSEDYKSVRWGVECEELPCNPERFGFYPFVLGFERFTAGRHFWEVVVGNGGEWAVGVARMPVKRKDKFPYRPDEGVWAMGYWGGEYCVFNPPDFTPLSLNGELKRIRVILNCAGGRVTFFDAISGEQLYMYSGTPSFCESFFPSFFLTGKAQLTLSP